MNQSDINLSKVIAKGISEALKNTPVRVVNESKMDMSVAACARTLKENCYNHRNGCAGCIFAVDDLCAIWTMPSNWKI